MIPFVLLLFIPLSLALKYLVGAGPIWLFLTGVVAVAILADWVRRATEQLAERAGSAIGGLLNVSFGSIAELVLALFVLAHGEADVVKAQITGSIIGTSLLGLGLAMLVGGLWRERQSFNRANTGLLSTLLILVVVALLLPAIFDIQARAGLTDTQAVDERLSIGASIVLLVLYGANLIFTLVTHRGVFAGDEPSGTSAWSLTRSLTVLIVGTIFIAAESELVSDAVEATATLLHVSQAFLGVIVLALVGTSADLFAAVAFARQDRMNIVFSICIGSAIQMALVVAPILVLASWAIGHPMNLVFNPLELFAIAGAAFIVRAISADGETNWFEGMLLIGVYLLFGLAFYFVGAA
ncbi:MAG: calcium/proton exchanger [Janthinobacterium lividum]